MSTLLVRIRPLLLLVLFCGPFALLLAQPIHTCTIMPGAAPLQIASSAPMNLPPGARAAVSYKPGNRTYGSTQWANGSTITVKFLGGSSSLRNRVMNYAREWTQHANLNFRVVNSGAADIRIGFTQNGGSWSVVGNASARMDQNRPSMNFGWLTDRTPDYEVKRTVLHEFGHALGLLHEHQNPAGGIPWDEAAVYDHYRRTQGWDQRTTYDNVMATANRNSTQYSAYDRASIMHYPIDARLTNGQYSVGMNNSLSSTDRGYIARMYPGRQATTTTATTSTSRPTTTTTSTNTGTTRRPPTTTTTTTNRPANRGTYSVGINNSLGQNQKAETVQLYIGNRRFVIQLDRDGRTSQRIRLNLPAGNYNYRVETSSTYFGYRNVRGLTGEVRRQYVEQKVPGTGRGTLSINGNTDLSLYGSYDKNNKRMKVYLAEVGGR